MWGGMAAFGVHAEVLSVPYIPPIPHPSFPLSFPLSCSSQVVCSIFPLMIMSALMQGKAFKGYAEGSAKAMEVRGSLCQQLKK